MIRNLLRELATALLILLALWTIGAGLGVVWLGWHMVTGN